MGKILLSILLLVTFMTATAAELACSCIEETGIHQEKDSTSEKQEHCKHNCTQCHFAVLIPHIFQLKTSTQVTHLNFQSIHKSPIQISQLLYRPPIA